MIVYVGLPGVKLTKDMPEEWKKKRTVQSAIIAGGALTLAIVFQHI